MPGIDISGHVEWSADDDWYYAAVDLRAPDGQVGTVEVRVDRRQVQRTVAAIVDRLARTAPAGVDVGAWRVTDDPERFGKLCLYVAGEEVKRQLADQAKRDGIVIAPWFGEWTMGTADAAYRMICAARDGDDVSIQQLARIREHAEGGDPAARRALQMINSVAKLVARGLPPPSVVASRLPAEVGAARRMPARRAQPSRRGGGLMRTTAPAARRGPARRGFTPRPAGAQPSGLQPSRVAPADVATSPTRIVPTVVRAPMITRPLPMAPMAPTLNYPPGYPYGYPPGYPYGMAPPFPGGGGGGGDMGPGEYLAPEEDNGAGGMLDDDGTYFEEDEAPEAMFSDEQDINDMAEYPEEVRQSLPPEDQDGDGAEVGDGPLPGEDGTPFPGEGTVGGG